MRDSNETSEAALYNSLIAARATRPIWKGNYCVKKGHREETCWKKFPSLRRKEFTSATRDHR